jgi:N-acyl-D-aspartate/D-glutamate deacylase
VEKRRESLGFIDVKQVDWNWKDIDGYYQTIKKAMPNVNLVTLVGHGSVRALRRFHSNNVRCRD